MGDFDVTEYERRMTTARRQLIISRHNAVGSFHEAAVLHAEQSAQCALKALLRSDRAIAVASAVQRAESHLRPAARGRRGGGGREPGGRMTITPAEVVAGRRARREALLERAREYAAGLDEALETQAVIVFGSVARGDFNAYSDIDVLVIADRVPDHPVDRLRAVGSPAPGGVQAVVWTPAEWRTLHQRGNPAAVEAAEVGVWLLGHPSDIGDWLPNTPSRVERPES